MRRGETLGDSKIDALVNVCGLVVLADKGYHGSPCIMATIRLLLIEEMPSDSRGSGFPV